MAKKFPCSWSRGKDRGCLLLCRHSWVLTVDSAVPVPPNSMPILRFSQSMDSSSLLPLCAVVGSWGENGTKRENVTIARRHSTISLRPQNGLMHMVIRFLTSSQSEEVQMQAFSTARL